MKILLSVILLVSFYGNAQNSTRFSDEIKQLQEKYKENLSDSLKNIVFAGSSSIKLWKSLKKEFPNHNIINSGFGGSTAADLLYYTNELITRYNPKKVFIYEGDNDIAARKNSNTVIIEISKIIEKIKLANHNTKVVLIAVKPSIARWNFKKDYKKLNRKMKRLAKKDSLIEFADVWKPMLNGRKVKSDIFKKDKLHMNAKGYRIWYQVIKKYIN